VTDADVFAMIAHQRRTLADFLDGLDGPQWDEPSLCAGWRVREVVAHLVMPFTVSLPVVAWRMLRRRGDFNRVADDYAREERRSNAELVAALRVHAGHRFTPPGAGPEAPLTDLCAHAQDIARPLGLAYPVPPEPARVALDQLAGSWGRRILGGSSLDGLSLATTDSGWRHGSGPEVRGSTPDMLVTLARRPAALADLGGDGVPLLRERLGA
jgi:uncharacterized protein (TIGR03083 family)